MGQKAEKNRSKDCYEKKIVINKLLVLLVALRADVGNCNVWQSQ